MELNIFRWFQKRAAPMSVEQTRAYELGQRAASSFAADVDTFINARFSPVRESYLDVLRSRFETAFDNHEAPPIILARIEYQIFLENVNEAKSKMKSEVIESVKAWLEVSRQAGTSFDFENFIDQRVQDFTATLGTSGLELLLGLTDRLEEADRHWRAVNRESAARFPIDTLPSKKSAHD